MTPTPALLPPARPVYVFALWARVPVFHRGGATDGPPPVGERVDGEPVTYASLTGCGRPTYIASWTHRARPGPADDHHDYELATRVRFDHARAIGRPCRQCFPEAPADAAPTARCYDVPADRCHTHDRPMAECIAEEL